MEKRIKYSKCLETEYGLYRKVYPYYKDWDKVVEHLWKANGKTDLVVRQMNLLKKDMDGRFLHIFLKDRALKDFLINTKINDYQEVISFIADNGDYVEGTKPDGTKIVMAEYFICIHIPEEESGYTFAIYVDETGCIRLELLHDGLVITMKKDKDQLLEFENSTDPADQEDYRSWKLIVNLIFYMKAFPECVIDGLPKGVRLDCSFKNKKIQLSTSPKIVSKTEVSSDGRIVTPHFRSGHFRYLRSDFFKNKQGQTIFIESCFVKGSNAKTVLNKEAS
ncbi:MAG: hypothetical protein MJZ37_06890 [Bacilli bacterium]|nr:hypothetical protein [Bacilli bacterium]